MDFQVFNPYIDLHQYNRGGSMLGRLSDLDLRHLRVFLAVVDAGGITPAQSALDVGQSTISIQLSNLETRLGYRLCDRGRGGFALTEKGGRFVELARGLVDQLDRFANEARHLGKALVGTLKIGMIGHAPPAENARLSRVIARFQKRGAAVQFKVAVTGPREMEERLLAGDMDLALGYFWHRMATLDYRDLFAERQVAYCGAEHELYARAGVLRPDEAAGHAWVWRNYPLPEAQSLRTGLNITALADNMEAVALIILSGSHLGFLPDHFAAPYLAQSALAALNPDALIYDAPFSLVTRPARQHSKVLVAFLQDIAAVWGTPS